MNVFKKPFYSQKLYLYLHLIIDEEFECTSRSHAEGKGPLPATRTHIIIAQLRNQLFSFPPKEFWEADAAINYFQAKF